MANKKTSDTGAFNEPVAEITETLPAAPEPSYSLEQLEKHCLELFGVPRVTFAGATANIQKRDYSVSEIKGIIETWCRKVVK